ncbi:MAG: hypothetical protein O2955_01355 [Planctomycetota bacterium]|nr:hypothetical protein [Planctomycetota bacterium]MDA1211129.1 hypothetical protein [Planctomycetota bacterium]
MTTLLIVFIGILGIVGLGYSLAHILGDRFLVSIFRSEHWGLSLCAGIAGVGWVSFFWCLMGGSLGSGFSWGLMVCGLLGGASTLFISRRSMRTRSTSGRGSTMTRVCQRLIGVLIVAAVVQAWLTPQRFWDERAIYAIKAKVLWHEKSVNAPILHDPDFVQYHPKYPLMLPLAEQHFFGLLDGVYDRWPKVLFPLMYAGMVLTFAGVTSRRLSPQSGWFCGFMLATTPVLMPYEYGFLCAQADAPVACFHGLAVLFLWDAHQETDRGFRRRLIVISATAAATAAFIKDEGLAFLLIDIIACGLALIFGRRLNSATESNVARHRFGAVDWGLLVGIAVVLLVPWFIHRRGLPSTTEMNYFGRISFSLLIDRLPTLLWSVPHLLDRMFGEWQTWGLHWWLAIAALMTIPSRATTASQQFLIWNLVGTLAALLLAGMIAPAELEEHLGGSTHRYLMQLVPVAWLLVAGQWFIPTVTDRCEAGGDMRG